MTDRELLRRYADAGDQEAFAQLVARHMGLVYGSARRQVGAGAEDITQAVFLLLAQRATSLGREGSLAGWLFQATRHCCRNFRRQELIRQKHEREAAVRTEKSSESGESAGSASEIAEFLDAGLAGLHAGERGAVLLRYLEGRSFEEMAGELGISVEAAKKRATRGLAQLREYFARRGHGVGGDSLAGFMTAGAAMMPPAGLLASVTGIAKGGASAAHVHGLASGAAKMMAWAKLKIAAVAILGIALGAAVAAAVVVTAESRDKPPASVAASMPEFTATAEARSLTLAPPAVIPTQQQLFSLMAASHARYRTVDIEYSTTTVDTDDKSTSTADEVWRRAGDRKYYHSDSVTHDGGQVITYSDTVVAAPTWSKKVSISSENPPNGMVMRGNQLMQLAEPNPVDLMELAHRSGDAQVKWNDKSGFLEVETMPGPQSATAPATGRAAYYYREKMIVDPSRGFVPVSFENHKSDGTVTQSVYFGDYREAQPGLWVPWKVFQTFLGTQREFVVKQVKVNGDISPDRLDFEFSPEVNVDDEISGQIYSGGVQGLPEIVRALAMTQPGSTVRADDGAMDPRAAQGAEKLSGVVRKISAFPNPIMMGRVVAGEMISQVLVVQPYGLKDPHDLKVVPSVDWIKVTLDESRSFVSRLADGGASLRNPELHMTEAQIADGVEPKWYLRYLVTATPPAGFSLAGISSAAELPYYLEVQAGPKDKWVRVPVVGELLPPVEIEPGTLLVESGKTEYRVSVHRNGPGSWKFKDATTKGEGGVEIQSVAADSKGQELVITVGKMKTGFVSGSLMVEFEGVRKPVEIKLVGLVNK